MERFKFEIKTARIARSGVYRYSKREAEAMTGDTFDSEYVNVYRPAVVLANAVQKFKSVPLTLEHPHGFVTPENYERLSIGAVMDTPCVSWTDGEVAIDNKIMLGSLKAYNALSRGIKELSPGYVAKFKKAHGEYRGQAYDAVMTDIEEVNHFAITRRARGGHQTRILDSSDLRGDIVLKSNLFHKIFKAFAKDSKSFEEVIDGIVTGVETADSAMPFVECLPDGDKKDMLSRYISDLSAGNGVFDSEMIKKAGEEIKKLYSEVEKSISDSDSEEEKAEEKTEDSKEEVKEETMDNAEDNTEEKTEDGCSAKDSDTSEENKEEERKDDEEGTVEDSQKEEEDTVPVGFSFDSLKENEKEKIRAFVLSIIKDSLTEDDSEIKELVFGKRKREFKRYGTPIVDSSAKKDETKGAIADYEAIRGR